MQSTLAIDLRGLVDMQKNTPFDKSVYILLLLSWWLNGKVTHAGDQGLIPGRDRAKSSKQAVTDPLLNARQHSECHESSEMIIINR